MVATLVCAALIAAMPAYKPSDQYTVRTVEGFTVYISDELLAAGELGERVLRVLEVKLFEINRVVPEKALRELHNVPIWVELEGEKFACCCYHPSERWLRENGVNPDKARAVEIANAKTFLAWSLDQPWMLLHELAHAYHHRVYGYDNAEIKAVYEKAKASGKYEKVLHFDGKTCRAYALKNPQEYFAELSEAFFGTNDFYPFVRAELMTYDPEGYELLKKLWHVP